MAVSVVISIYIYIYIYMYKLGRAGFGINNLAVLLGSRGSNISTEANLTEFHCLSPDVDLTAADAV